MSAEDDRIFNKPNPAEVIPQEVQMERLRAALGQMWRAPVEMPPDIPISWHRATRDFLLKKVW